MKARALVVDWPLLAGILTLIGLGVGVLYSAGGQDVELLLRHGARIAAALVVMLVVAQIDPKTLRAWAPYFFIFGVVLLSVVAVFGVIGKGAQRWLELGVVRFQPAEMMKLAVPMAVAWWLSRSALPPRFGQLVVALVLVGVPVVLVMLQPDLGTSLLIAASGAFVIFLAGMSWRLILGLLIATVAGSVLLWGQLHSYQQQRVLTLFDPWADPLGSGYQIIQSTIAQGSGGIFGKGWLNGSQSQLEFIPERATDFIFAVYAEEFGWLGVLILICLYFFLSFRGLYIASRARENFSRILAGSFALTLFLYVFVNIGMVSGVLPVVGVPLPLISYGGTSMVTLLASFGILMAIHTHRRSRR